MLYVNNFVFIIKFISCHQIQMKASIAIMPFSNQLTCLHVHVTQF